MYNNSSGANTDEQKQNGKVDWKHLQTRVYNRSLRCKRFLCANMISMREKNSVITDVKF